MRNRYRPFLDVPPLEVQELDVDEIITLSGDDFTWEWIGGDPNSPNHNLWYLIPHYGSTIDNNYDGDLGIENYLPLNMT